MLRCVLALVAALAFASASSFSTVSAQEPRDPLIDPPTGGAGSRFQIVGQTGWTPGDTVALRVGFTTSPDPLASGVQLEPASEFTITVLADGTWSFPIVVDELFRAAGGAPETPGYIVVRATSRDRIQVNAYVYTVRSVLPAGAEAIAAAGAGPGAPQAAVIVIAAMFSAGIGGLLMVSGALRRRKT